jgi:hypothetical protein
MSFFFQVWTTLVINLIYFFLFIHFKHQDILLERFLDNWAHYYYYFLYIIPLLWSVYSSFTLGRWDGHVGWVLVQTGSLSAQRSLYTIGFCCVHYTSNWLHESILYNLKKKLNIYSIQYFIRKHKMCDPNHTIVYIQYISMNKRW